MGVDAANLYGFSISQSLPGGCGILFKKTAAGKFSHQLMIDQKENAKSKKFSTEAIAWLCWCQEQSQFKDVKIEHYLNGGERAVTLEDVTFSPDGFCQLGSVMHIFQYHGCFFHAHDCNISRKSVRVKSDPNYQARCAKIDKLASKYGVLHRMYSCAWTKIKKTLKFSNPYDIFGKSLVSENEIIGAIMDDRLFGIIKCDINSTQEVIDRYMSVNYPPITAKVTPDESMISPDILRRMKESGKKIAPDQLTQVKIHYLFNPANLS